jgi:potassium-transporting ATPase KdpC subunit
MHLLHASPRHGDGCISEFNALLQLPRIARARGISIATLRALVARHTVAPQPGDRRRTPWVDICALNAALARMPSDESVARFVAQRPAV